MDDASATLPAIDFAAVFDVVAGPALLLLPDAPQFIVRAANNDFLALSGNNREKVVGRSVFSAFGPAPAAIGEEVQRHLIQSFETVLSTGKEQKLSARRFDVTNVQGKEQTYYWEAVNKPVKNASGSIEYILHCIFDVTHRFHMQEQAASLKNLHHIEWALNHSSLLTMVFKGEDLVVEYANDLALQTLPDGRPLIGLRLTEAIPEMEGQAYPKLLLDVMRSGKTYRAFQAPTTLLKQGQPQTAYYNFTYQQYQDPGGDPTPRVLAMGTDVTEWVQAQQQLQEKTQSLELAAEVGELGMFNVDLTTGEAFFSSRVRQWFGLPATKMPLQEVIGYIHPDDQAMVSETIERMVDGENSNRHDFYYRVGQNTGTIRHLRSIGQVQYKDGKPVAITGILQDGTAQMGAKQKLQESEARFRNMVAQAPVAMTVLRGPDFVFEIMNTAMMRQLQVGEEAVGKRVLDVFPEVAHQPIWEIINEVYQTGKTKVIAEHPIHINIGGSFDTHYYTTSYVPLQEGGRTTGILQTLVEVTDSVKSRQAVEENAALFRALVYQTPFAAAFYKGPDFIVDVANPAMLQLWGKNDSVIGKKLKDALPELEGQHFLSLLDQVYTTGKEYVAHAEMGQLERDGVLRTFYFDYSYKPLLNADGKIYGLMNTAIDVTEQVMARKALEENEINLQLKVSERTQQLAAVNRLLEGSHQYLQQIIDHFEEAICTLQPVFENGDLTDFRFGMTNARYAKYAPGYTSETLQGKIAGAVFSGYRDTYSFEVYKQVYKTGVPQRFEQHYTADGLDVYLVITATKMGNEVIAHLNDITELKKLQLHLLGNIRELERSNQNLEEFAHAASHDLKEPIRKVQFFTNRLRDQLAKNGDTDSYTATFSRIENATTRMGLLIDDLLTYSHVSQRPHEKAAVNLNDKITRVLEDLELDIQQKAAQINVGTLPTVQGFRRQLQQMFQNLISNALKYSKNDVAPQVEVGADKVERNGSQWHHIWVRDNGIGFEQEYARKIFQMFTRLHGKSEYSGTGIGLSIVRKVVDNHGGVIEAESTPGVGSTFHIYLPVTE